MLKIYAIRQAIVGSKDIDMRSHARGLGRSGYYRSGRRPAIRRIRLRRSLHLWANSRPDPVLGLNGRASS